MIRHVVMFRWKEGVEDAQVQALLSAATTLPALIPQIVSYSFGTDLGTAAPNFDFAVTAQFETLDDYIVYRDHPDHQAMVQTYVLPFIAERTAVQFEEP